MAETEWKCGMSDNEALVRHVYDYIYGFMSVYIIYYIRIEMELCECGDASVVEAFSMITEY